MLNGIRIDLIAYTASFRVPCFVGHQITLPVPPLSMIYGMISAAMGRIIHPNEVEWLAFRWSSALHRRSERAERDPEGVSPPPPSDALPAFRVAQGV